MHLLARLAELVDRRGDLLELGQAGTGKAVGLDDQRLDARSVAAPRIASTTSRSST
jgi:predicted ATP-dependent Lon-type protease